MRPRLPKKDIGYLSLGDTKASSEHCVTELPRPEKGAHLKDLICRKFRATRSLPSGTIHATLLSAIRHVVFLRSKEKMIRPNTPWIVAFMENRKVLRDWSEMDLVRNPVRSQRNLEFSRCAELTVPVKPTRTFPIPAPIRININFGPEPFFNAFPLSILHSGEITRFSTTK